MINQQNISASKIWYLKVGSILSFLCDLLGFVCGPSNVCWNLRIINTLPTTFCDLIKRFIYHFQHFFHNYDSIIKYGISTLSMRNCTRIIRTFGRHPCHKICNNTLYTNQSHVAFTWGFKCLFCFGIYCCRLKGVYCGVDAIMASNLCSMFLIHLQRIACYWCSTVPFCNLQ